jgi:hypothetical protein
VSWFQIYAFFGTPIIVLGIGMLMYYIAVRDAEKERDRHHLPGE